MVQETNEYWPVISDEIGTTNASGMTGDGIVMAQAVGADTVGMGFVQMMPIADPVTGDLFTGILTQSTANYLFVNSEGKRFVNECEARDTLAKAAIENGGIFYMISDLPMAKTARVTNWETEMERGNAIMADTLEELGFDEAATQNLIASVAQHNKAVETGIDPEFGKNTFELKIEEAPFLATPRKPSLHHTMGGLRIDTQTHVLDQQGNIIPGLYAAGEVTGGIHGGNRLGGNAVADCFTFGKIAGETACGN